MGWTDGRPQGVGRRGGWRAWALAGSLWWAGLAVILALLPAVSPAAGDGLREGPAARPAAGERLSVVATFSILADLARTIGGETIDLQVLVGPGQEVHEYEPTPQDARALGAAQVLLSNGLGFETWLPRLQAASGFAGQTVVASQGVAPLPLPGAPAAADRAPPLTDPHAWQDLGNGMQYVRNIARGLAQADPAHADAYAARAERLLAQLQAEEQWWQAQLARVAPQRRILASAHNAFAYLGQAYGIRVLPLAGAGGHSEPSARAVAQWVQALRAEQAPAVFFEHGSVSEGLRQMAREADVPLAGPLFADTLDQPGRPAGTYLGLFHWNAQQLLQAWTEEPAEQAGH